VLLYHGNMRLIALFEVAAITAGAVESPSWSIYLYVDGSRGQGGARSRHIP
jgi:hypothetical protein